MRGWWRRVSTPSLVRRIMLAQMLLLTLLWCAFLTYVLWESLRSPGLLAGKKTYDTILAVVDQMADRPQARYKILREIDLALREDYGAGDDPAISTSLIVRSGGQVVYASEGAPLNVRNTHYDEAQRISADGSLWRSRTARSPRSDAEATLVMPADEWHFFIHINTRGYYLLPLLISLPFLLLPAWLSVRVALRPWSKVAREVAARGPQDLTPLQSMPKHEELRNMVDCINDLLGRVRESAERERAFIADAAHELRTPLAAMRINVEALQSHVTDRQQRELLGGILNSGDRATRLVRQLLLLMRSETRTANPRRPVALTALVQERLAVLSPLAARCSVELELDARGEIRIDGMREGLVSLVDNLVENAIKYSPAQGRVEVALHASAQAIVLRVSDAGPGIAPELRERVFDRFFRDPDQTQSGSGLGLAIVQTVARQHGGSVALDTSAEGGLMVTVTLAAGAAAG
ncbi:sensor histidine kinase [Herbaspirillum robiniae]|uniref:histidine kinase n=1 Tax=Herbaspirillum robiniae TaxID=2014887 RepID=A0A246WQ65_9BURK|nr:ATP-binding protein [Herbaspirillum robiniae]NUU01497.1 sensor histidine kinase [Herbaspirillum robiniae]OWY28532.1 two-component sensor histidine kinase [Herbaspirillum robiniae]